MGHTPAASPVHVSARVLATKTVGVYQHLSLVAPGVGERIQGSEDWDALAGVEAEHAAEVARVAEYDQRFASDEAFRNSPWFHDPRATWDRWREAGADGAIVLARTTDDVDAMVDAAARW